MAHIWQSLRSGDWLTPARARGYSLILLIVSALAVVGWIALSDGLIDRNGKPIGTDFSSFYAAGSLALEGRAGAAYDMAAHHAREQQYFGADTPYYAWLYPPNFFLLAAPLALLPYPLALALWQGCTLALYLAVIAAILYRARQDDGAIARLWLPVAAAFPAVFINLGNGQNGFLSAALLGAALVSLPQRPIVAGVLFGLLAYKPQLALVIPFALLAGRQWRTIVAAAVTVAALAGASFLLFGPEAWWSFLASTETARKLLLEQGNVGFEKLQSIFAAVRMWGGAVTLAYLVQGAVSALAVGSTAWVWHSVQDRNVKAALLLAATALASPHILDYDLMLLGPALAFFIAAKIGGGFRDYEISLLAAVWIAPPLARSAAGLTGIPIGFLACLTLFALILRCAVRKRDESALGALRVAQA
ncbi:MAG: glycosyltransferase family 87 protein [Bradyrhizobium sp.]